MKFVVTDMVRTFLEKLFFKVFSETRLYPRREFMRSEKGGVSYLEVYARTMFFLAKTPLPELVLWHRRHLKVQEKMDWVRTELEKWKEPLSAEQHQQDLNRDYKSFKTTANGRRWFAKQRTSGGESSSTAADDDGSQSEIETPEDDEWNEVEQEETSENNNNNMELNNVGEDTTDDIEDQDEHGHKRKTDAITSTANKRSRTNDASASNMLSLQNTRSYTTASKVPTCSRFTTLSASSDEEEEFNEEPTTASCAVRTIVTIAANGQPTTTISTPNAGKIHSDSDRDDVDMNVEEQCDVNGHENESEPDDSGGAVKRVNTNNEAAQQVITPSSKLSGGCQLSSSKTVQFTQEEENQVNWFASRRTFPITFNGTVCKPPQLTQQNVCFTSNQWSLLQRIALDEIELNGAGHVKELCRALTLFVTLLGISSAQQLALFSPQLRTANTAERREWLLQNVQMADTYRSFLSRTMCALPLWGSNCEKRSKLTIYWNNIWKGTVVPKLNNMSEDTHEVRVTLVCSQFIQKGLVTENNRSICIKVTEDNTFNWSVLKNIFERHGKQNQDVRELMQLLEAWLPMNDLSDNNNDNSNQTNNYLNLARATAEVTPAKFMFDVHTINNSNNSNNTINNNNNNSSCSSSSNNNNNQSITAAGVGCGRNAEVTPQGLNSNALCTSSTKNMHLTKTKDNVNNKNKNSSKSTMNHNGNKYLDCKCHNEMIYEHDDIRYKAVAKYCVIRSADQLSNKQKGADVFIHQFVNGKVDLLSDIQIEVDTLPTDIVQVECQGVTIKVFKINKAAVSNETKLKLTRVGLEALSKMYHEHVGIELDDNITTNVFDNEFCKQYLKDSNTIRYNKGLQKRIVRDRYLIPMNT